MNVNEFQRYCQEYDPSIKPEQIDKEFIRKALILADGVVSIAANILHMSDDALLKRMSELDMKAEDFMAPDNVGMPGVRR